MRKISLIIMGMLLILATFSGCTFHGGKKDTKASDNKTAMGRYIEEDIKFPEGQDSRQYIALTKNPDGVLELYITNVGQYEKYQFVDDKWVKADAKELRQFRDTASAYLNITDVFYGEDGVQYILGEKTSGNCELYKHTDKGVYEKIAIHKFEENYEDWGIPSKPNYIKVLKNGLVAAIYPMGEIEVYSEDGKSVVGSFTSGHSTTGRIEAEGNILYYTDQSGDKLLNCNMDTNEQEDAKVNDVKITDDSLLKVSNGVIYLCDSTGIHLFKQGGSIWETVVDGNQTSLSMPVNTLARFILGSNEDYYCVLREGAGFSIKHYYYDKDVKSEPSIELSIYSINESETIRQAIAIFQNSHPDLKINYQTAKNNQKIEYSYGVTDPEETFSQTDYVNALNTELLAKKGPDIMILDGLPMDSYIEKGVLENLGSIFNPMVESGTLMENIADNYIHNGKVYAMPVRFAFPIIYGCKDAVNSADTPEKLADYATQSSEIPILHEINYRSLAAWFLLTYSDQFMNSKNQVDEEAFKKFLESIKTISDRINASDDAEIVKNNMGNGERQIGYWVDGSIGVDKKILQSNMEEMGSIDDFMVPLVAMNKWNGSYNTINNTFRPNILVGMNSSGKHKDLAKEFIQLLYSKDIQSLTLNDGFPINKDAMESLVERDLNGGMSFGDDVYTITASYPIRSKRDEIYNKMCELTRPMMNDTVLIDMILDETERYLRDDITVDQATQNVVNRINRYLSE